MSCWKHPGTAVCLLWDLSSANTALFYFFHISHPWVPRSFDESWAQPCTEVGGWAASPWCFWPKTSRKSMAESQNLRTMESSILEKAFRITKSSGQPELSGPTTTPRPSVPCPCSVDEVPLSMQKSPPTPNLTPLIGTQLPVSTPFPPGTSPSPPPKATALLGTKSRTQCSPSLYAMQLGLAHRCSLCRSLCHTWLCPGAVPCNSELLTLHVLLQPNLWSHLCDTGPPPIYFCLRKQCLTLFQSPPTP